MSIQSLSRRVQTVVRREAKEWALNPLSKCPRAWTRRFVNGSGHAARVMAQITSRVKSDCPWWLRGEDTSLSFQQAMTYLMYRTHFMLSAHAGRVPTDCQISDGALLLRLLRLRREYEQRTGDAYPQSPSFGRSKTFTGPGPKPTTDAVWWLSTPWWPELHSRLTTLEQAA